MSSVPPIRSTFVTVLAWIFIGLAGMGSLIGVLQNIMLQIVFLPSMDQAMAGHPPPPDMPPAFGWMTLHITWFFRGFLLLSLLWLAGAIGLLLRKEWARRLFIGLLVFGIAYQLAGMAFQWWMMDSMREQMLQMPPKAPDDFAAGMDAMLTVMRIFGVLLAVGLSLLFGWLVKRLSSA